MEKRVQTQFLRLGDLVAENLPYQRPVEWDRVQEIIDKFDPLKLTLLGVSWRGIGEQVVVQGQHRWHALMKMFGPDYIVECRVWLGLSIEEEADLFADEDGTRKRSSPRDRLRANLVAKHPDAIDLQSLIEQRGWRLRGGSSPSERTLACVAILRRVQERQGLEVLNEVLAVLEEAGWTDTPPATLVDSLAVFWSRARSQIVDPQRMGSFLRERYGAPGWLEVQARRKGAVFGEFGLRKVLVAELIEGYNRGKRGRARLDISGTLELG